MPRSYRALWFILSTVTLLACKKDDEDDDAKTAQAPAETPPTAPTPPPPPAPVIVEGQQPTAGVTPRIKQEVDNRTDPVTGSGMAVTGMKGSFTLPAGFGPSGKQGDWTGSKSADGKVVFGAVALGPNDNPTAKRDMGAAAQGWTNCVWGNSESVTVGADKLPASVADGTCQKGPVTIRAGFMSLMGDVGNVVAIGGYEDPGSDGAIMYMAFRSPKKGGQSEIAACCQAIKQNMASAPPQYLLGYQAALAACNAAMQNPSGYQAVKGMLGGVGAGGLCK